MLIFFCLICSITLLFKYTMVLLYIFVVLPKMGLNKINIKNDILIRKRKKDVINGNKPAKES